MKQRNLYSKLKKGGEEFTPHMMYNPETMEGLTVYSHDEHLLYKDQGYLHQEDLEKMMLGGLNDNKKQILESNKNDLFRKNPSIATQNEENPGLNNLNSFVNSVALNTQGSLMDGAIQQTSNQFFLGGNSYGPNFGYAGAQNFNAFNTANTNALNAGAQGVADLAGFGKSFSEGLVDSYVNPNMTTKVKTRGKGFMDKLDVLGENIINAPRNIWGKATAGINELKDFRSNQKDASLQPFYNNLTKAGVDINNKDAVNKYIGGKSVVEMNELLGGMLNNQQRFGGPNMDFGGTIHTHPHKNPNFVQSALAGDNYFEQYANQNFQQPAANQGTIIGSPALGITPRYFGPPKDYMTTFRNGIGLTSNGLNFSPAVGNQQSQVQRVGTAKPVAVKDEVQTGDELSIDPNMPGVTTMDDIANKGVKVEVDENGNETIVVNEDVKENENKRRGNSTNPNLPVDSETTTDADGNLYLPEQVFRLNPRAFGNSTVDGVMTSPYGAVAYNPNETYLNKFKHKTNMFGGNKTVMKFDHAGVDLSADRRARRKERRDARNAPDINNSDVNNSDVNPEDYEVVENNTSWQNNRPETFYHAEPETREVFTKDGVKNVNVRPRVINAEPYVVGDAMSTNNPNYVGSVDPSYAQVDQYGTPTLQNPMQTQLQNNTMMNASRMYGGSSTNPENMNYDYFNRGGVPSRRDNRQFAQEQIQGRDKFSRQDRRRLRRDLNRGLETQEGYMQYQNQEPVYEQAPIVREDNSFEQNISPMPLIDPGMVTMPEAQPMNLEAANAGVSDDMSFGQAFATANKALGENGTFMWRGKKYGTRRDPNWRGKKKEEPKIVEAPIREKGQLEFNKDVTREQDAAQAKVRETVKKKQKAKGSMELEFIQDAKSRGHIPYDARIGHRQDGTAYVNIDGQNRSIKSNDGKTWMLSPEGTNAPIYQKTYKNAQSTVDDFNADVQKVSEESLKSLPGSISYEAPDNSVGQNDQLTNLMYDIDVRDDSEAAPIQNRIRTINNELMNAGVIDGFMTNDIKNRLENLIERFPAATSNEIAMFLKSGLNVPEKPVFEMMNSMGPDGKLRMSEDEVRQMMLKKYFQQSLGGAQYGYGGGNMYGQGISGYYEHGGQPHIYGNGGADMYGNGGANMYGQGGINYFPQAPKRRVVRMQGGGSDMVSIHQGELAKLQEMAAMGQQAMQSNAMYEAMNNGTNPMG